jgi:hypothetical protein
LHNEVLPGLYTLTHIVRVIKQKYWDGSDVWPVWERSGLHPPEFFLAELEFRFAGRHLVICLWYLCMYGLSVDVVRSSDYIAGVTTTCLRLVQLGAVRPGCVYLGTEHCCYSTFEDVAS